MALVTNRNATGCLVRKPSTRLAMSRASFSILCAGARATAAVLVSKGCAARALRPASKLARKWNRVSKFEIFYVNIRFKYFEEFLFSVDSLIDWHCNKVKMKFFFGNLSSVLLMSLVFLANAQRSSNNLKDVGKFKRLANIWQVIIILRFEYKS